jgi:GDP-mannose 6-dehydrogenase
MFGMGYVGIVSAACLARDGHHIVGIDPNLTKVELVNSGQTPIIEQDMPEMVKAAVDAGRLTATTDVRSAVMNTELSLVCVGTPSRDNGSLNLQHVQNVCRQIGEILREKDEFHTVVMRSTMLPGSMRDTVRRELELASEKTAGTDFGLCNNPEFMREGSAVYDYFNPPKTVIGELESAPPMAGDQLVSLYKNLSAPLIRTSVEVAEMVKYVDNTWHAVKIGFGNEIGRICKVIGIDSHDVMDIFVQDRKLNISAAYLKPGFAFGGSCLPKDLRALSYMARSADLEVPILSSVLPSNRTQVALACDMIGQAGSKQIGLLGLSFKAGTDDLRESPLVDLVEWLIGKGYKLKIYDRNVNLAQLVGANRDYILKHIPHISELFVESVDEVVDHSDVIVIGNQAGEFAGALSNARDKLIIDLVRIFEDRRSDEHYQGLSW